MYDCQPNCFLLSCMTFSFNSSSLLNNSSIVILNRSLKLIIISILGLFLFVSHFEIDWRLTYIFSAKSSCDHLFSSFLFLIYFQKTYYLPPFLITLLTYSMCSFIFYHLTFCITDAVFHNESEINLTLFYPIRSYNVLSAKFYNLIILCLRH